ncbi:twin transmembrane helix small protein [Rhizorhapis sp. SPR117]|uniref:twin transmembrane helix small protein n=1 Tax=Rhizorhapis sp. SPR117 TaxID=2912611 RepID=UPI001F1FB02B|nr:twin transmembrane helix small protein [Rhizorhapis sp. SPR117]
MTTFLIILIILAAIATVVALVRGIITFLRTTERDLKSGTGPSASSLKQNRMMMARIGFQAVAVLLVAFLLLMTGGGR